MRFFCVDTASGKNPVQLDSDESHHIRRVLRLKHDQPVTLFDGMGTEASGTLILPESGPASVQILTSRFYQQDSNQCIAGVAIPDNRDALALMIRSLVQLDVSRITLLESRYCGVKKAGNIARYMERWKGAVLAASKQCGRRWFPVFTGLMDLESFFRSLPDGLPTYVGWEPVLNGIPDDVSSLKPRPEGFAWIVGPEGGWSEEDWLVMSRWNPSRLRFGNLTLTSEVAAIAGISALKTQFGCWRVPKGGGA